MIIIECFRCKPLCKLYHAMISLWLRKFYCLQISVGALIHPQDPVIHVGSHLNFSIKGWYLVGMDWEHWIFFSINCKSNFYSKISMSKHTLNYFLCHVIIILLKKWIFKKAPPYFRIMQGFFFLFLLCRFQSSTFWPVDYNQWKCFICGYANWNSWSCWSRFNRRYLISSFC